MSVKNLQGLFVMWKNPNEYCPDNDFVMTDASLDAIMHSYWGIVPDQRRLIFELPDRDVRTLHAVSAARIREINKQSLVRVSDGSEILCEDCLRATTVTDRTSAVAAASFLLKRQEQPCERCRSMAVGDHLDPEDFRAAPKTAFEALRELVNTPRVDPSNESPEGAGIVEKIKAHMQSQPARAPEAPLSDDDVVLQLAGTIAGMLDKGYSLSDVSGVLESHGVKVQAATVLAIMLGYQMARAAKPSDMPPEAIKAFRKGPGSLQSRMLVALEDPRAKGCLSVPKAARYLNVPEATLNTWRFNDSGPMYYKFGNRVWYSKEHLDEFNRERLAARKALSSGADAPQKEES